MKADGPPKRAVEAEAETKPPHTTDASDGNRRSAEGAGPEPEPAVNRLHRLSVVYRALRFQPSASFDRSEADVTQMPLLCADYARERIPARGDLVFEYAAKLRDEIKDLRRELLAASAA